jgi:hypothetical protein
MSQNQFATAPRLLTAFFIANGDLLQLAQFSDPNEREAQATIPRGTELVLQDVAAGLQGGIVRVGIGGTDAAPAMLTNFPQQFGCVSAAFIPVHLGGQLRGLLMLGAREGQSLDDELIESYHHTIRLTAKAIGETALPAHPADENRLAREARALSVLATTAATVSDLKALYASIHDQFRAVIGERGFLIALYDQKTNSINVPYLYEDGNFSSLESFPLGEGLTSLLVRTREPLMIVEDTEILDGGSSACTWGGDRCDYSPGPGAGAWFPGSRSAICHIRRQPGRCGDL